MEDEAGLVERPETQPPDTGGRIATSSSGPTASPASAGSPLRHTRQLCTRASKSEPQREHALATTSPTVSPSISARPVPAATRTDAKSRNLATGSVYGCAVEPEAGA